MQKAETKSLETNRNLLWIRGAL